LSFKKKLIASFGCAQAVEFVTILTDNEFAP